MAKLKSIKVRNYKSFFLKNEIKICPITIVLGKNSSGKSALSRIPLLLSKSLGAGASEPVKIKFDELEFGGSFKDLIHNKFEHGSVNFCMNFQDDVYGDIELEFEVQNFFNSPIQIITRWKIKSNILNIELVFDLSVFNPEKREELQYFSNSEILKVFFAGVIPSFIKDTSGNNLYTNELNIICKILNSWSETINYIGPFRAFPDRVYRHYGQVPTSIGHKGEYAPSILGMSLYTNKDLIYNVGNWFQKNLGGWKLDISNDISSFEVVLISPDNPEVKINLADVGHGMSQVLPLVVRCMSPIDKYSIDIVEQPELHLHPAAHGELANLFVEASLRNQSFFIIETHSENFLLRMKRLVIEGVIKANDVVIYWVDDKDMPGSYVTEITIDENGVLSDWPDDVFSEDHEEVLKIRKALSDKSKN